MHHFLLLERLTLAVLILLSLSSFIFEIYKRFKIILKGLDSLPTDRIPERLIRVFNEFVLQKKVLQQRFIPGLMHAFVFWGFMAFSLITIDHFLRGFNLYLFSDSIRHYYSIFLGLPWSILVLIGILYLAYRRFIIKPIFLGEKVSYTSGIVAFFISVLMITYMIDAFWIINNSNVNDIVYKSVWWIHAILILAFLVLIPKSKHLHLVLAPVNIFFKPFTNPYHRPVPIDMEAEESELETLLGDMNKLTKNQTLDVFSCVECGRCTEVCPANRGGGLLDPKNHFMLDLKDPLMKNGNTEVVGSINVEAGWECTSCQACSEVCPVGNQVEKSEEIRNLQVLVEGNVPQEYQKLFMNLQTSGNTEGATSSELSNKLPLYDGTQEYVIWLGCFAKYAIDPKYPDSVLNLTKILDAANITYGILAKEKCTGEPANKLGDKLTYNMLMNDNIETLKNIKKIITTCPHCSVNLGTEYPKYKEIEYEVFHHTQIIEELIKNNKINVNKSNNDNLTFHDPCNLSRTMNEVDAPRTAINAVTTNFKELEENGSNTLCCGAGGGLWWKKETKGRAHLVRAEQVIESKVDTVVTGCSFCYGMMNQGLGPLTPDNQETIKVKDIADLVAENLN